jgi:signal transduction histidine kinase/CheY-like chemotaxis protein/AraC-like DNA-binding protein/ligand-binding sensor domain-containing protein
MVGAQKMLELSVANGLSNSFVTAITQDSMGYIWAGTLNGLNRYDGHAIDVFSTRNNDSQSLANNFVNNLVTDNLGRMWVITKKSIQVYQPLTGKYQTPSGISAIGDVTLDASVIVNGDQMVVVAGNTIYFFKVKSSSNEAVSVELFRRVVYDPFLLGGRPTSMMRRGDALWLVCGKGVFELDKQDRIKRICPEIQGDVYLIWEDTLHRQVCFQTQSDVFFVDEQMRTTSFRVQGSDFSIGLLGKRFQNGYLLCIDKKIFQWDGISLKDTGIEVGYKITASFVDAQGNIWLGLDAQGLVCVQNRSKKFLEKISGNFEAGHPLLKDADGSTWLLVGNSAERIKASYVKYQKNGSGAWVEQRGQVLGYSHLEQDNNGVKWGVNAQGGLDRIEKGQKPQPIKIAGVKPLQDIFGVRCLPEGRLFLLSKDGSTTYFYNPANGALITISNKDIGGLENQSISVIGKPNAVSEWVWVTAVNTVFGLKPDWEHLTYTTKKLELSTMSIVGNQDLRLIFAQADFQNPDWMWIGTWGGLLKYNLTSNRVERVQTYHISTTEAIFCMAQSEPNILLLGAQHGLIRFDIAHGESQLFTIDDGLPANEFNRNTVTVLEDGKITMGTVNGYVSFYPKDLQNKVKLERMVISSVRLGEQVLDMQINGSFFNIGNLSYQNSNLIVQVSLLDFTNPGAHQYRFRLGGKDSDWTYNGQKNTVSMAGLAPGNYVFEVQGSLDGGHWSESAFLHFCKEGPWWSTWWAMLFFLLLITIPTAIILRNKVFLQQEKLKNKLLQQEVTHEAELTSAKERLLANITHDLRTPLTLITGLAKSIQAQPNGVADAAIETIQKQSNDLLVLVTQILDLSKIKALGSIPLSPKEVALNQFLPALLASFTYQAELKSIDLLGSIPDDLPVIRVDENALKSILSNLLSNALKFAPERGRVALQAGTDSNLLQIRVCDNGPGIRPDEAESIFDRYYQSQETIEKGGYGIGLAYAVELANLLGCKLTLQTLQTTDEFRSVFELELPLDKVAEGCKNTRRDALSIPAVESASTPASAEMPLILIVEDQVEMARYIRSILEPNFRVVTASNGAVGLQSALQLMPDLVISDIMMPVLSGIELCKKMRADVRTSHIPLILLTAKTDQDTMRAGLACGASVYLTKPFDGTLLLQYVANSLQLAGQIRSYFKQEWLNEGNQAVTDQEPLGIELEAENIFIQNVKNLIASNFHDENFAMDKLAEKLGVSQSQLKKKMSALGGETAGRLLRSYRLKKAKEMILSDQDLSVAEIAFACGFADANYFSTAFSKEFALPPTTFKKGPSPQS